MSESCSSVSEVLGEIHLRFVAFASLGVFLLLV